MIKSSLRTLLVRVGLISFGFALAMVLCEATLQLRYRITQGEWLWAHKAESPFFQWHPYLVGASRPGATGKSGTKTVTINSRGFRGPEIAPQRRRGTIRIVTLGGSSTFGTQVADEDAWPRQLARRLGNDFEVVNLGVPGYSSVENLIQTAFLLSDLNPDIAIYYEGWNDLRNMHVRPLAADYSDFHGKEQLTNLDIVPGDSNSRLATAFYVRNWISGSILSRLDAIPSFEGSPDKLTDRMDARAVSLYSRNLRSIVAVCRSQGVRPIMVPHLLNYAILTSDQPYFWIPYVKTKDLQKAMGGYNDAMKGVTHELAVDFVESVLETAFGAADFVDQGHFNEPGSRKFAGLLSDYLQSHPTVPRD
jgi:lysophospholipase L1-like esterase